MALSVPQTMAVQFFILRNCLEQILEDSDVCDVMGKTWSNNLAARLREADEALNDAARRTKETASRKRRDKERHNALDNDI